MNDEFKDEKLPHQLTQDQLRAKMADYGDTMRTRDPDSDAKLDDIVDAFLAPPGSTLHESAGAAVRLKLIQALAKLEERCGSATELVEHTKNFDPEAVVYGATLAAAIYFQVESAEPWMNRIGIKVAMRILFNSVAQVLNRERSA